MSTGKQLTEEQKLKLKQKEERRLAFEAKRAAELKSKDDSTNDAGKSKADLKRERREKQEAQRAAKEQTKEQIKPPANQKIDSKEENKSSVNKTTTSSVKTKDSSAVLNKSTPNTSTKSKSCKSSVKSSSTSSSSKSNRKEQLLSHIPTRETDLSRLTDGIGYDGNILHPDILRVGLQMNSNQIVDPTSRCLAFLCALKSMVEQYEFSSNSANKSIARDLETRLDQATDFLNRCRFLSVSLRNVIRIVRTQFKKLSSDVGLDKAKQQLSTMIDRFIHEEIECGLDGIKEHGSQKINDDDVVLVFNYSFLVRHILGQALSDGKRFKVIVVDAEPKREGLKMLDFLINLGVDTSYILINAVAHVMKGVSKVLLEANTLLANGYMMADLGSSQIALIAKSNNKPVLICCETYKFSERVHTDSFVFNELGPIDEFFKSDNQKSDLKAYIQSCDVDENKNANVNILNLYDDVTPPDFISLVITEMGFLPCTAVPAIIRRNISKFQLE